MKPMPVATLLALCLLASIPAHAGGQRGGPGKPIVSETHRLYTGGHRVIAVPHKPAASKLGATKPRPAKAKPAAKSAAEYHRLAKRVGRAATISGDVALNLAVGGIFVSLLDASTGDVHLDSMIGLTTAVIVGVSTGLSMWLRGKSEDLIGKQHQAAAAKPTR